MPFSLPRSSAANHDHRSLPIVRVPQGQTPPPIRTQARSATILPSFVGLKFLVYNGRAYHEVIIKEDMVGHKLGEFSPYVQPSSQGNLVADVADRIFD